MYTAIISASTRKGNRAKNQDNMMIDTAVPFVSNDDEKYVCTIPENDLLHIVAVSDGISKGKLGHYCSLAATNEVAASLEEVNNNIETDLSEEQLLQIIDYIFHKANKSVMDVLDKYRDKSGCTMSLICWYKDIFIAVNVGDSPIYMLKGKDFLEISEEHTLAAVKRIKGEKFTAKDENVLVKYLGKNTGKTLHGEFCIGKIDETRTFLVCSDGIPKKYSKKQLKRALKRSARKVTNKKVKNYADIIVKKSAKKRKSDNCTAIMISFVSK